MLDYDRYLFDLHHLLTRFLRRIPKRTVSAVSQYFRWIRWTKERVEDLGKQAPENVHTNGVDYPTYGLNFQKLLIKYILQDNSPDALVEKIGQDWYNWIKAEQESDDTLLITLRAIPSIFDMALKSWTARAGDQFQYE